jgi:hypothetical protein
LDHGHIKPAVRFAFASPNPSNVLGIKFKKKRKLLDPLIQQRLAVDQDEIQALTDQHVASIDGVLVEKEAELMEV